MRSTEPDRTSRVDDEHVLGLEVLPPPDGLIREFPVGGGQVEAHVAEARARIRAIVRGEDRRLLVVVGPCSIHDPHSALDYAERLAGELPHLRDALEVVMRVYFEKPRTTVGWKGLVNDPHLDESCDIVEGLRLARSLLLDINRLGLPCGSELLDTLSPQYLSDLMSWGAIGARTTESQVHRELASGASMPIGFKNGTTGAVKVAVDAILAAAHPHRFLGMHKNGRIAVVRTEGNPDCHLILRGGESGPNHDAASVAAAAAALRAAGLPEAVMVDCSHANARKQHARQMVVAEDLAQQLEAGQPALVGAMVESHLLAGAQAFRPGQDDPARLVYGQSITDPCLGWADTVALLERLAQAVRRSGRLAAGAAAPSRPADAPPAALQPLPR